MGKYLLDANCFYSIKNNEKKKQKLYQMRNKIVIVPIAIMEIANIAEKDGRDFDIRKDAMRALNYVNAPIIQQTGDDLVARAFGQKEPQNFLNRIDWKKTYIHPIIYSNSYSNAKSKRNFEELKEWKRSTSIWFNEEVIEGAKIERYKRIEELKFEFQEENERILKHIAVKEGKESAEGISGYIATIIGLSVRAGLNSDEEFQNSITDGNFNNKDFMDKAINNYDGSLDSYINFYQCFQSEMTDLGMKPEKNSIWDLDYLFYLDKFDINYFVTNEQFILDVGNKSFPGKVIHFDSIL